MPRQGVPIIAVPQDRDLVEVIRDITESAVSAGSLDAVGYAVDAMVDRGVKPEVAMAHLSKAGLWVHVATRLWPDPDAVPGLGVLLTIGDCARFANPDKDLTNAILHWLVDERYAHPMSLALGGLVTLRGYDSAALIRDAMARFLAPPADIRLSCGMAQADLHTMVGRTVLVERHYVVRPGESAEAGRLDTVDHAIPEPMLVIETPRRLAFRVVDGTRIEPFWRVIPMAVEERMTPLLPDIGFLIDGPPREVIMDPVP
jgi:hypothetical protein